MTSIFYYSPSLPPASDAAAIRNYWFVKSLKEKKFQVHSVSHQGEGGSLTFIKPASNKASIYTRLIMECLAGIELFLRIIFSRKDLYILSSPPFVTVVMGVIACILMRKKYILDIRDIYPEVYFELKILNPKSLFGKFFIKLTQIIYNHALFISTTSQGQKESIMPYTDTDIFVFHNGFDPNLFTPAPHRYPDFTVAFHGNLGRFQNIELLIKTTQKVYAQNPAIKFLVIGDGPGGKILKKNPLPNLIYLGPKKFLEIAHLIGKCHLGLSLRSDDLISQTAIPVKIYEYLALNMGIVVTPKGEAGEIVEKIEMGKQFHNSELNEITDYILQCAKDPQYLKNREDKAFQHKWDYSREKISANLVKKITQYLQ